MIKTLWISNQEFAPSFVKPSEVKNNIPVEVCLQILFIFLPERQYKNKDGAVELSFELCELFVRLVTHDLSPLLKPNTNFKTV